MKIREYRIIQDNELHPQLQLAHEHNWSKTCKTYDEIYEMFKKLFQMHKLAEEYVYVLALDHSLNPKGVFQLSHGTSKSSEIRNRELYIFLLLSGADQFVVAHNHVNGCLDMSADDYNVTSKIGLGSSILDLIFTEHMIVTKNGYTLIKEEQNAR